MSTLTELAQQIAKLYPLKDKRVGKRYRVVGELAGMTELERSTASRATSVRWRSKTARSGTLPSDASTALSVAAVQDRGQRSVRQAACSAASRKVQVTKRLFFCPWAISSA